MGYLRLITLLICFVTFNAKANSINANKYGELKKVSHLFLIDQDSGEVLFEKNADEIVAPSSMTKLMTAYVVLDEIKKGRIKLNNQCLIGRDAWRKKGSTMFLNAGDVVSIEELLIGLITVSGNDSAVALAQSVAGSTKAFVRLMNETAIKIGLENSSFQNPHGLNQHGHFMTLRDLAILTKRLRENFPEFMHYFDVKEFTYQDITQKNRNPLFKEDYYGATGMKTGYTSDGGFGVVGTATRGNRNLIGVVNNAILPDQRTRAITQLLDFGFDNFEKITFFNKNETVTKANVWLGKQNLVDLIAKNEVSVNVPINKKIDDINFEVKYQDPLFTPINKDQEIASLEIKINDETVRKIPLYAKTQVKKASYFSRMWMVLKYKLSLVR